MRIRQKVYETRSLLALMGVFDCLPVCSRLPFKLWKGSDKAKATLSACTTGLWLGSVILGICLYVHPREPGTRLPLALYDKVLRKWGPLLPFLAVAVRLVAQWKPGTLSFPNLGRSDCTPQYLYGGITALRMLVYLGHLQIQKFGLTRFLPLPKNDQGQIMSDHIVLGASMVAILQVESIFLQQAYFTNPDMFQRVAKTGGKDKWSIWRSIGLVSSGALLVALFIATSGDMFFTAHYFHPQVQSGVALVVGFVMFQFPAVLWAQYRL